MDDLPGSPPAVPGVGSGNQDDQIVERRQFNDLHDPQPEGKKVTLKELGGLKKLLAFGRMLVILSSGFSISEITVRSYYIFYNSSTEKNVEN